MPALPSPVEAAATLLGAGRPAEAAALLQPYVDETPGYAGACVVYARALELSGDAEGALTAWHRAYLFAPESPLVRRERARLLREVTPPPSDPPLFDEPDLPVSPDEASPGAPGTDLDALIEQLENAPRIRPDDDFDGDDPTAHESDEEVVSETMASILAAQGRHAEAARLYDALAEQRPDDADRLRETARALRSQATA